MLKQDKGLIGRCAFSTGNRRRHLNGVGFRHDLDAFVFCSQHFQFSLGRLDKAFCVCHLVQDGRGTLAPPPPKAPPPLVATNSTLRPRASEVAWDSASRKVSGVVDVMAREEQQAFLVVANERLVKAQTWLKNVTKRKKSEEARNKSMLDNVDALNR
jgi:hypothetical protein